MKVIFTIVLALLFATFQLFGQTPISYTYDTAGNRIQRAAVETNCGVASLQADSNRLVPYFAHGFGQGDGNLALRPQGFCVRESSLGAGRDRRRNKKVIMYIAASAGASAEFGFGTRPVLSVRPR